jgi:hypothetical protein
MSERELTGSGVGLFDGGPIGLIHKNSILLSLISFGLAKYAYHSLTIELVIW